MQKNGIFVCVYQLFNLDIQEFFYKLEGNYSFMFRRKIKILYIFSENYQGNKEKVDLSRNIFNTWYFVLIKRSYILRVYECDLADQFRECIFVCGLILKLIWDI